MRTAHGRPGGAGEERLAWPGGQVGQMGLVTREGVLTGGSSARLTLLCLFLLLVC